MKINPLLTTTSLLLCVTHSLPTYLNSTNPSLLHSREIPVNIDPFHAAVCRGLRLSWAMQLPSESAFQFLAPIDSPYDGDLRDDLHHWGYTEIPVQGYLCDFDITHHLEVTFEALGVDPRSEKRGGPNRCFHVEHQYLDHPLPIREQHYLVNDKRYRMTGAHFSIGINAASGIVYFLNRRGAQQAAKMYWGVTDPPSDQLPALRSSSDIAWGFYSRMSWGRLGNIRAFMSMMVVNADTMRIVDQVMKMRNANLPEGEQRLDSVQPWPGTTFDVNDVEGQALLGSPNGLATGFFLAQHKRQLGGNKVIDRITVFRSEQYGSLPNLLFWVA